MKFVAKYNIATAPNATPPHTATYLYKIYILFVKYCSLKVCYLPSTIETLYKIKGINSIQMIANNKMFYLYLNTINIICLSY